MKDYLILKDLLAYLTYENITGRDRDCQMNALIRDKAVEFIPKPTLTLIENPLTKEGDTICSEDADYEDKLRMAKENGWQIWHDNNDTMTKILHDKVTPYTIESMCHYKDIDLPKYLDNQVTIIKEKLQARLIEEPLKKEVFIQYIKGELHNKINDEQKLFDKFSCTKDAIIEIKNYLLNYWNIDLKLNFPTLEELPLSDDENEEIIMEQSVFDPKQCVKKPLVYEIYNILIDNRVLGYRNTPEGFYEALTSPYPNAKIRFNCQNTTTINILKLLGKLFFNFTPKAIQKSEIFYTKGGTSVKSGDYYRFSAMKPKQEEEFEKIKIELEPLINKAIDEDSDK